MTIADKILRAKDDYDTVYEAGYEKGKAEGGDGALEVWKAILVGGERTDFANAFARTRFSKDTMRLPYDIKPTTANNMFYWSAMKQTDMFSMTEVEKRDGKVFDFSNCTSFSGTFNSGCFDELNVIDLSKATSTYQIFYNGSSQAKIKRINRLIFSEDTAIDWGMFGYCTKLEHVGFEGVISKSGLDMQWSTKLSKDSITSLVSALSPTTSNLTVTLSKQAVENAFNIEITPFKDSPSRVFTNNGDGSVTLNEIPSENTTYTLKDDLVLPKGSYRMMWTEGHCDWDYANVFVTLRMNGEVVSGGDTIYASENFVFNITDDEAVVSLSVTARPGLGWSGEPLKITPVISPDPDWETLVATKPNWTISLV